MDEENRFTTVDPLGFRVQGLGFRVQGLISNSSPSNGLNIRVPIIIAMKGRGLINHGSGLPLWISMQW